MVSGIADIIASFVDRVADVIESRSESCRGESRRPESRNGKSRRSSLRGMKNELGC